MTSIWGLLKEYVREFEEANNVRFDDAAWKRIKKLEEDIREVARGEYGAREGASSG